MESDQSQDPTGPIFPTKQEFADEDRLARPVRWENNYNAIIIIPVGAGSCSILLQSKAPAENFTAIRAAASVKATAAGDVRSSGNSDVVGNVTPAIFPRKIEFPDGGTLARPIGRNEAGIIF